MCNTNFIDKLFIGLICTFMAAVILGILVALVYAPKNLTTEAYCLDHGYLNYKVTYDFQGYCVNSVGSITHKVISVEE